MKAPTTATTLAAAALIGLGLASSCASPSPAYTVESANRDMVKIAESPLFSAQPPTDEPKPERHDNRACFEHPFGNKQSAPNINVSYQLAPSKAARTAFLRFYQSRATEDRWKFEGQKSLWADEAVVTEAYSKTVNGHLYRLVVLVDNEQIGNVGVYPVEKLCQNQSSTG